MRGEIQQEILDMIASGCTMAETAEHVCRYAERFAPGAICTVIRVDHEGVLHPLAGPSIPPEYSAALEGVRVGPTSGSCGTAAYRRASVSVTDIFTDPLWADYPVLAEMLAEKSGVTACWSSPILLRDGRVLGAFGFYYREHRGPTEEERRIVEECVDLCALALERDEVRAENFRLSYVDLLTGLGNRASFLKTLERYGVDTETPFAVLVFDIDRLARFNDVLGHSAGDRLIHEIGKLVSQITAPAPLFRIDADEFAVFVDGADAEEKISQIGREILAAIPTVADRAGHVNFPLSVSCGVAVAQPSAHIDVAGVMQRANLALHHAKQTGRGSCVQYEESLSSAAAHEFRVLQTMTHALAEARVEPYYQPIVHIDTQEIVSLEALCRVRTPAGDVVSADQFGEALQSLSMGSFVTDRMLELVARDMRLWIDEGLPLRHVNINLSVADFRKERLRERVAAAFAKYRVPLEHVILEVTESVYMDEHDRRVAEEIERLRADGLRVALDDFGTGFASLTHLLHFPVDILKIDKSFVHRISDGDSGVVIIKALLDMAHGLGMRVVAEGVETEQQALQLQRLGCALAQGYLFGRPVSRDETTVLLKARLAATSVLPIR
ncbi:putative bifunctional diguanylate cyclase/phosphodiesterase [Granulicella cerasi]|uniref:Bifunctional diguanylate cyclase/phosphodiesterase n=1 Tax=Granulicella cerasi TaxID=741063 RepID=A0ABW1Z762_9BACT|nr:EAL domain-containing protein [Granulicella cerasi]